MYTRSDDSYDDSMMTPFVSLPDDILRRILLAVDLPTLLSLSATCTTLYTLAATITHLKPYVTRDTSPAEQIEWMRLPHVGPRISSLRISRALREHDSSSWLHSLTHMRSFMAAFCRITPAVFSSLRPDALLNLDVHQLVPFPQNEENDVFSTSLLAKFTNLRRCHITFGAGWSLAMVGKGIDTMSHLQSLSLRRVPALSVTRSIFATDVHLHATDVMACRVPLAPRATSLRLECDDHPLDLRAMQLPADTLEFLEVRSKGMVTIPALSLMTRLTALDVRCHAFMLPDIRTLTLLKRMCVDVEYCVVVDADTAVPKGLEHIAARACGVPFDLRDFCRQEQTVVGDA